MKRKPSHLLVFPAASLAILGIWLFFPIRHIPGNPGDLTAGTDSTCWHQQVNNLEKVLERYSEVRDRGGWQELPDQLFSPTSGKANPVVYQLKERLKSEGYSVPESGANLFDSLTAVVLASWQRDHGLPATGSLDQATITQLNISVDDRIKQIRQNIERWKRIPRDTGQQYILVNIPDYRLEVYEKQRPVLEMKVITGRPSRPTPEFSSVLTSIVFNPTWHVPPTIFYEDMLPEIQKDPSFLARQRMTVYRTDGSPVSPDSVDWNLAGPSSPYYLEQAGGPHNALGAVKFLFPNKYHVYIHDTPARKLFEARERAFSSGCIRASDAIGLAAYLLRNEAEWDYERIEQTINSAHTIKVPLTKQVPVYIGYFTSWVDSSGHIQFRKDIYGKD